MNTVERQTLARNVRRLGHLDLPGAGQVTVRGSHAYVGHIPRTAQMVEGRIAFGETHLFVGRGYVVSVRHGASASYAAVRQRCEACPTVLSQGEDYIVYAILDFIVDNYMPVVEKIQAESRRSRTPCWRPR
jgi:Mg2+ and Co2+ transporter CorA